MFAKFEWQKLVRVSKFTFYPIKDTITPVDIKSFIQLCLANV